MTQQQSSNSSPGFDPHKIGSTIRLYVKALVEIVLWLVVAAASLGGGYLVLRIVWWGVVTVLKALGVTDA